MLALWATRWEKTKKRGGSSSGWVGFLCALKVSKSHPRQWVDGSSPFYLSRRLRLLNPANGRGRVKSRDTTGFSRVEVQFLPSHEPITPPDTTDFSRVEVQLRPSDPALNGRN